MLLDIKGIHIYYEKSGSGKPLLLLHGNGETHEIFRELAAELSENYTVYAIDSPGHGQSSSIPDMSYEPMADIIFHFIEQMSFQNPILYGYSDGGIIGLIIAIKHPDLLSKLAVSGVNTVPNGLKKSILTRIEKKYEKTQSPLLSMMLTQPNISDQDLQNISIPVLFTAGEHDIIRQSHTKHIAKQIPNSILTILPEEDHGSYITNSTKLFPILQSFLTQDNYIFRTSELEDLDSIMTILSQAQASLKQLQVDQWQNGYPNETVIENDIVNQISYVLLDKDKVIATTAVCFEEEPTYQVIHEGAWLTPPAPYAVIHRIAISNSYKNKGIASQFIRCIEQLCDSKSIQRIKIDTHKDNLPMKNMLKKNGFQYCGIIYLEDGDMRLAYEKKIEIL